MDTNIEKDFQVQDSLIRDDEKNIVKKIAALMVTDGYSFQAACDFLDVANDNEFIDIEFSAII